MAKLLRYTAVLRSASLACALFVLGCSEQTATEVLVHFDAEPGVSARAASFRVRIYDGATGEVRYDQMRSVGGASSELTFPATVPVVPFGGDASRNFHVLGELADATSTIISTVESDETFTEHELREVTLVFRDAPRGDAGTDGAVGVDAPPDLDAGSDDAGSCECPCADDACVAGACTPAHPILAFGAGAHSTCTVDSDGALYCWGANDIAQLGLGTMGGPVLVPAHVTDQVQWAAGAPTPVPLPAFADVDPSAGFACGRDASGQPYCWGSNRYRELGIGSCCAVEAGDQVWPALLSTGGTMRDVSTGGEHACGISQTMPGRVYCWGRNDAGQTTDPVQPQNAFPHRVGADEDWIEISSGDRHSCGIRSLGPGGCGAGATRATEGSAATSAQWRSSPRCPSGARGSRCRRATVTRARSRSTGTSRASAATSRDSSAPATRRTTRRPEKSTARSTIGLRSPPVTHTAAPFATATGSSAGARTSPESSASPTRRR